MYSHYRKPKKTKQIFKEARREGEETTHLLRKKKELLWTSHQKSYTQEKESEILKLLKERKK